MCSILIHPGCSTISAGLQKASKFIDPNAAKEGAEKLSEDSEGEKKEESGDTKEPQQLLMGFMLKIFF